MNGWWQKQKNWNLLYEQIADRVQHLENNWIAWIVTKRN